MSEYASLSNALACVRKKTDFEPKVALVLGSGLGGFAQNIREEASLHIRRSRGFRYPRYGACGTVYFRIY
jgi:purine-nucleoside phosphorylase